MKSADRLLSHSVNPQQLSLTMQRIKKRIQNEEPKAHVTVEKQLEILNALSQFPFGQFLLQNQGLNGYWTHYMLTYPWKKSEWVIHSNLEKFLLAKAPTLLATQQRFRIFLGENQRAVHEGAKLACIPCGMMGELLYLDYQNIKKIQLIGIDLDSYALQDARQLADKQNLRHFTQFFVKDAWKLSLTNEFDLISSNGLNIYESDHDKVTDLYRQFYQALKKDGRLVTSFLTFPTLFPELSEWDMGKINAQDLLLQRIIFADVIGAKWQCYRTSEQTKQQLTSVGFKNIQFIYDDAHMFPTVVAIK